MQVKNSNQRLNVFLDTCVIINMLDDKINLNNLKKLDETKEIHFYLSSTTLFEILKKYCDDGKKLINFFSYLQNNSYEYVDFGDFSRYKETLLIDFNKFNNNKEYKNFILKTLLERQRQYIKTFLRNFLLYTITILSWLLKLKKDHTIIPDAKYIFDISIIEKENINEIINDICDLKYRKKDVCKEIKEVIIFSAYATVVKNKYEAYKMDGEKSIKNNFPQSLISNIEKNTSYTKKAIFEKWDKIFMSNNYNDSDINLFTIIVGYSKRYFLKGKIITINDIIDSVMTYLTLYCNEYRNDGVYAFLTLDKQAFEIAKIYFPIKLCETVKLNKNLQNNVNLT